MISKKHLIKDGLRNNNAGLVQLLGLCPLLVIKKLIDTHSVRPQVAPVANPDPKMI